MGELVVGILQMTSNESVAANTQFIIETIKNELPKLSAQVRKESTVLICTPENSLYMRVAEGASVPGLSLDDECFSQLGELSVKEKIYVHIGAVPLWIGDHLYNSSVLCSPSGEVKASYQKIHLFDIQLQGQQPIRESDVFSRGKRPSVVQIGDWKVGESICYDMRFAELYSHYAKAEVDLILVPSAFLVKTGQAHWHSLLRARAIESQSYLVAAAQGGEHIGVSGGRRQTFGHSLIVDPWGQVLQDSAQESGLCWLELKRQRIREVRTQIPMSSHRQDWL